MGDHTRRRVGGNSEPTTSGFDRPLPAALPTVLRGPTGASRRVIAVMCSVHMKGTDECRVTRRIKR